MSVIKFLIAAMFCVLVSTVVNAEVDLSYEGNFGEKLHQIFCRDNQGSKLFNDDFSRCMNMVEKHSGYCDMHSSVLFNRIVKNESDDINLVADELNALTNLHVACLKFSLKTIKN